MQFLLIVLSVKVTYIRNGCLAWVAYSQGCASDDSRAHLVIESGSSIAEELVLGGVMRVGELSFNTVKS